MRQCLERLLEAATSAALRRASAAGSGKLAGHSERKAEAVSASQEQRRGGAGCVRAREKARCEVKLRLRRHRTGERPPVQLQVRGGREERGEGREACRPPTRLRYAPSTRVRVHSLSSQPARAAQPLRARRGDAGAEQELRAGGGGRA